MTSGAIAAATPAQLEDALVVASLAHATATTPKQRREAWDRLQALRLQKRQASAR